MSQLLNASQVAEIERIIEGYRPNDDVLKRFRGSNFAVIAGPAAAGKDTLRSALIKDNKYEPVLSTTTRPARQGEIDGQTYHFSNYQSIKEGLQKGKFFQAALVHKQQVSVLDISKIQKLGKDKIGLSILIVQTERELSKIKSDIKTVFLVPPSLLEMKKRIKETRSISEEETSRRLEAAKKELACAIDAEDYYCIISDGYERVRKLADDFLRTGRKDSQVDSQARMSAKRLIEEIKSK